MASWGRYLGLRGKWRRLHNEEMYVCSWPSIFQVIRSKRMRWVGHGLGQGDIHTGFWWGNLREGDYLRDLDVDGRIILKWILRKWDVRSMDWIELAQDMDRWRAVVIGVMNFRFPWNVGNFLTGWESVSFSRRTLICWIIKKISVMYYSTHLLTVGTGIIFFSFGREKR